MSLKALAGAVIQRDTLAGQKRDIRSRSVPPLPAEPSRSVPPESAFSDATKAEAAGWHQGIIPNSRRPLIPDAMKAAIVEVATDYIAILKVERNILRFQRRAS
jgi:hypothetical protein